jgi:copper(I)-binding protein
MDFRQFVVALAALALLTLPATAHEITLGSLEIGDLWTRATPPGAPTAGGYLTVTNNGSEADRLISATTPLAEKTELHMMETKDGVMTMHPVEGGIEVPAGGSVTLAPGGLHLMFIGIMQPLAEGGQMPVTLTFEKAGSIDTYLHVIAIGAMSLDGSSDEMHMDEAH